MAVAVARLTAPKLGARSGRSSVLRRLESSDEVAFYVLLPIAAWLLARPGRPVQLSVLASVIGVVWLAGWLTRTVADIQLTSNGFHLTRVLGFADNSPLSALALFCPGMIVALASSPQAAAGGRGWAVMRRIFQRPRVTLVLVACMLAAGLFAFRSSSWPVEDVVGLNAISIAFGVLLGVIIEMGSVRFLARLAPVGLISYGIYLWHWVVLAAIERQAPGLVSHGGAGAVVVDTGLLLVFTVPLATASWILVERPAIHSAATAARRLARRMTA